jgi:hypothetical protein
MAMNDRGGIPVWEPITLSDTASQNYYGVLCLTAGTFIFKSEGTGTDISVAMTAGMYIPGRIVLAKTTGASGTYAGGKAT